MVHCNLLDIQRVIMHRILPRTAQREHVEAECNEQLIVLDNNIKSLVINRLTESFGRQGKSFELTIEQDGIKITVNAHFINNAIKILKLKEDFTIKYKDEMSPLYIINESGEVALLMPTKYI